MRNFDSIVKDKEIPWVRHWIDATFEFSKNFIKPGTTNEIDFEALGKEEWEFRQALKTKDFTQSKRAEYLWNEAMKLRDKNRANGSKGGRPRKTDDQETNRQVSTNAGDAAQGDRAEATTTVSGIFSGAEAPTRKDGDGHNHTGDRGTSESATSAPSQRTGAFVTVPPKMKAPVREPEVIVSSLAYRGTFGNVVLDDLQYAELGMKFGNKKKLDRAIDSLSAKIENGEENPKSHYATLVKWSSYRADMVDNEIEKENRPHMTNMEMRNLQALKNLGIIKDGVA